MWRRIVYVLLFLLTVFYGIRHWEEIRGIPAAFQGAHTGWIVLAFLVQALNVVAHTLAYRAGYAFAREKRSGRDILPAILGSLAVNVAAPSLNAAGVAYMVDEGKEKGYDASPSLVAILSTTLADGTIFLALASLSFLLNRNAGVISSTLLLAAIILAGLILFIFSLLFFGWRSPHLVSRFSKLLGIGRMENFTEEWQSFTRKQLRRDHLVEVFAWEAVANIGKFIALALLFPAFRVDVPLMVPILGYVVATLFTIVSVTPSGIGVVEGAMTLALVGLGVPLAEATSIMFVYRVVSFWIPFGVGVFVLHRRAVKTVLKNEDAPTT